MIESAGKLCNHKDTKYSYKDLTDNIPNNTWVLSSMKKKLDTLHKNLESIKDYQSNGQEPKKPDYCKLCQTCFTRKWSLKNHMILHNNNMYEICENCNKVLPKNGAYNNHVTRIKTCQTCSLKVCRTVDFQQHLLTHEHKTFIICRTCDESFNLKRDLRRHEQQHKEEGITKPFSCIRCHKMLQTRMGANGCEMRHTEKYRCHSCNRNFITPTELKRHNGKAHNEKRKLYICLICNPDLQQEINMPNKTTVFAKDSALKRHLKRLHPGGKSSFTCITCRTHFTTITSLTAHCKAKHPDEWLKCEHCNQQFRAMPTLEDHIKRTHADEHTFVECHICFELCANINIHMKECHPGTFVKCEFNGCLIMERSQEKLNLHKQEMHAVDKKN